MRNNRLTFLHHFFVFVLGFFLVLLEITVGGFSKYPQNANASQNQSTVVSSNPQEDVLTLLKATSSPEMVYSISKDLLDLSRVKNDDPMWPVYMFLLGEVYRLRGETDNAKQAYRSLTEWAATDPYSDTWGGSGLATVSLWRWAQLLAAETTLDFDSINRLLSLAEQLKVTRFTLYMFRTPLHVIGTLPQLEEDILRHLAMLAYAAGMKDKAQQLFLEYLSIASTTELNRIEIDLLNQLTTSGGLASPDRLDLLRGKRFWALNMFRESRKLLRKAQKSEDLQIRAEASYYLARQQRAMRKADPKDTIELLNMALEDAENPELIQKAFFQRAIVSNREGRGRNEQQFIHDLLQLIEEFPDGQLADDALYQLGKYFEYAGDLPKALKYYAELRNFEGQNDWANLAAFRPALALYSRGEPEDIEVAMKLLQELEETHPKGPLHFAALFWLGRMAEESGDPDKATSLFQRIVEEAPYDYYAIRARMHLDRGNGAKEQLWPGPNVKQELLRAYQQSQKSKPLMVTSPYHLRLRYALESGLYRDAFGADQQLRKKFPSQRQEKLSLTELDQERLLTRVSLLLALRQDALAARDRFSTPENLLHIAGAVGRDGGDWPLTMNLVMPPSEPTIEKKAAVQRSEQYLSIAYPLIFEDLIKKSSSDHKVRPELIYSVIRRESLFYPAALSPGRALGLFQFTPGTFNILNKDWNLLEKNMVNSREAFLFTPELSIDLGARWFKEKLLSRYNPKKYKDAVILLAVMEHNAGAPALKGWIKRWKKEGRIADLEYMVETVRFGGTRVFMQHVLTDILIVDAIGIFK